MKKSKKVGKSQRAYENTIKRTGRWRGKKVNEYKKYKRRKKGYDINNIDTVIIAQEPVLSPFKSSIKEKEFLTKAKEFLERKSCAVMQPSCHTATWVFLPMLCSAGKLPWIGF
jgi:hypothetical protein